MQKNNIIRYATARMTRTARKGRNKYLEATPWEELCTVGEEGSGQEEGAGK